MSKEKYIIYDIETLNVDLNNKNDKGFLRFNGDERIFSVAFVCSDGRKDCYIVDGENFKTEVELLEHFCSLLKDYELVIGFNNHRFDDAVMSDRLQRLGSRDNRLGRFVKYFGFHNKKNLDVMRLAKLLGYSNTEYISLNDLCAKLGLDDSKEEVNPITAYKQKQYSLLREYNLKDVDLTYQSLSRMDALNIVEEIMELTKCKYRDVFSNVAMLNSYIRNENIPISNQEKLEGKNLGGFNYYKTSKELQRYYELNHFDVKSMYPSIMILIQADSGYDYPGFDIENLTLEPFGKKDLKDGQVGQMAKKLFDARSKAKKQMDNVRKGTPEYDKLDHKQRTFKILVNSLYGALDSNNKKPFLLRNKKLASLVTFLGRDILMACIKEFDGVYGKTDSIWVDSTVDLDDLNQFVNDYLMVTYNLDNQGGIVRFEYDHTDNDGNPLKVQELIVKDKNNYVEILGDGTINKKGSTFISSPNSRFESDIIDMFIINQKPLDDLDGFIEASLKNPLDYFSKKVKLSSKQKDHERLNTLWMDYNDISYEWDYRYNSVYSEAGWVLFDKRVPKIKVSPDYAHYLAYKLLYNLRMISEEPSKSFSKHHPLVPVVKNHKGRFIPDTKKIKRYLDIDIGELRDHPKHSMAFYARWDFTNIKSKLFGLLCHPDTGYIFMDIDDNVDHWKRKLSKEFPLNKYIWTNTRSGKYHLIIKTKDEDPFTNIRLKPDVEWKSNAIVPFDFNVKGNDYTLLDGTTSLDQMNNISYNVLCKKLDKIGLLDGAPKKTTHTVISTPLKDVADTTVDKIAGLVVELEKLRQNQDNAYKENNQDDDKVPRIGGNALYVGVGTALKEHLSQEDCLKVYERLRDKDLKEFDDYFEKGENIDKEYLDKIKGSFQNPQTENLLHIRSSIKDYNKHQESDAYKSLYNTLVAIESKFEEAVSADYLDIFGNEPFEFNKMLEETFEEYTDKADELTYYILALMGCIIFDQYRVIEITDPANSGKTWFIIRLCKEVTPSSMLKLEGYYTFTESAFRQLCSNVPGNPLDNCVTLITDVPKNKIQEWEDIFDMLKPVLTQDNDDGVYILIKSAKGGNGVVYDVIFSKNGLLIVIANPDGFKHNKQNERRSSILRITPPTFETQVRRHSDENPLLFDEQEVKNLLTKIKRYMISLSNVNKDDINIKVPDEYIKRLLRLDEASAGYWKKLCKCFCFLENRQELDDDTFERFLEIVQLSITSNLSSNTLDLLRKIKHYLLPVSPSEFDGYSDEKRLEILSEEGWTTGKGNNRFFTVSNIKTSIGRSRNYDEKQLGEMIEALADDDNQYIFRFCKNRINNWVYCVNADVVDEYD